MESPVVSPLNFILLFQLYNGVIDEVIAAVRDAVLDEGIDEAVLGDLKTLWKKKLDESRALEGPVQDPQQVGKRTCYTRFVRKDQTSVQNLTP